MQDFVEYMPNIRADRLSAHRYHPMNLLLIASLSSLFAILGGAIHTRLAFTTYRNSKILNQLDDSVRSFHADYGLWGASPERLVAAVWIPVVVGLILGILIFLIVARLMALNREEWIEFISLPIERVPTLKREWREFRLMTPFCGIAILGIAILGLLEKFVFDSTSSGIAAYGAALIVVYPTWRSVYDAAKERLQAPSVAPGPN